MTFLIIIIVHRHLPLHYRRRRRPMKKIIYNLKTKIKIAFYTPTTRRPTFSTKIYNQLKSLKYHQQIRFHQVQSKMIIQQ
jgi:hypothetical protein